ncbi:T9SS-dependent choice-of-anchor J family protein [Mesonia aestuariivivens]|uniref:Choice-of-anchor J domain-containing protein n=1 Tax=Mesonia aestuariivivens TaxID=2796128 RepID=A0ABS6VZ71_9FLAO|nr:choice-of-anchor J domain-containing protein [Mesonia aestuariivivens]MBW2960179.1 choice-of-anchor J domain-containing protein [Mesonia aestuariivivens]
MLFLTLISQYTSASDFDDKKKGTSIFLNSPEYLPLTIQSGFNEDVIANGTGPTANSTTSDIDGTGFCFLVEGLTVADGDTPSTVGLNPSGYYDETQNYDGAVYQFANYDENNALRLSNTTEMSGTLTFENPASFTNLYLLATSGSANSTIDVIVNFEDNTSQTINGKSVPDWYNSNNPPAIITGIGRVNTNDDNIESPFNNPRIYHLTLDIDLANYSKNVESLTITKTNTDGVVSVFAVSGKTSAECLQPTNLDLNNITTNSAYLTWDAGSTETAWQAAIQESGLAAPESGSEITTAENLFENLLPATEYTIYIRAACGDVDSYSFWSSITFFTNCEVATGLEEGFESSTSTPNCWSVINEGDSNTWFVSNGNAHSGTNYAQINYSSNAAHNDYLITAPFLVTANTSDELRFWARNYSNTYLEEFNLKISTTGNSEVDFTETLEANISPSTTWTEYSYNISDYIGETVYIAFQATSQNQYYLYIDDVQTFGIPLCPSPTDTELDEVSTTTATLSWTAGSTETSWEVAIVETGIDAPTTGEEITEANYTSENLTSNTSYDFYIRAICNENDSSEWMVYTFNTNCETAAGLDESFEDSTTIPNCWTTINDGASNNEWEVYTFAGNTGSNSIRIESDTNAHDDYLISPKFSVTANESDLFNFWSYNQSQFYAQSFDILISTTGRATEDFIEVLASDITPNTSWGEYTYDLSEYVGSDIYIAFRNTSINTFNLFYLYLDDIKTSPKPFCEAPTNLNAPVVTLTSAELTWDANDAGAWDVAVQELGAGIPTSGEEVLTNSYNTDITEQTVYEFYVRVNCNDVDGYSPWAGPYTFGVYSKLEPVSGLTDDVIANGIGAPSTSTINDIDGAGYVYMSEDYQLDENASPVGQNGNGLPINGDLTKENAETSGLHFQMSPFDSPYEGNNSLRLETVSANGTLTFNDVEPAESLHLMVTSGSGSAEMTGTITFDDGSTQSIGTTAVPDWYNNETPPVIIRGIGRLNLGNQNVEASTTNPRIYELEIAIDEANQSKSISELYFEKASGDGVINVFGASIKLSLPSCLTPTEVVINNINDNSADVSWTAIGNETEWKVVYGPEGFDIATEGTTVTDDDGDLGVTLTNLNPEFTYDVYVIAVCDADFESDPSNLETFTTLQEPCEIPTAITITNITDTSADISWNANSDEIEWIVTYGLTGFNPETEGNTITDNDGNLGVTLTDLNPEFDYEVYVTAVCDVDYSSEISEPANFTTLQEPCETPTEITITNITTTAANVSWTSNGDETEWIVTYGVTGFNPENEGNTFYDNDGTLGVTLTNLEPQESYDIYVTAICALDNFSENSNVETFETLTLGLKSHNFAGFSLYPNPTRGLVNIQSHKIIQQVIIYNLLGQKVFSKEINSAKKELNINHLGAGSYLMQISINNATKSVKLIVIN